MPRSDVGVFLPSMSTRAQVPGDMAAAARHAEDLGFESVWVVDQLVAGTGAPLLDSGIALAAAAAATTRVRLGFGVMILPLRPVVWAAKQVASLQHVSGDRVLLGVGAGGDRHEQSWVAAGVPRQERGRRMDTALRALPGLISGQPTRLDGNLVGPLIQLSPPATVPPLIVGGMSTAAMARAARYADGWFPISLPAAALVDARARLAEMAAAHGRPEPSVTVTMMIAVSGDPSLPDPDALSRLLADVDGPFGIPADQIPHVLVRGSPAAIAARLAEYAEVGAERVVVTLVAGSWERQSELLAEARAMLD